MAGENTQQLRQAYAAKIAEAKSLGDQWRDKPQEMPAEIETKINGLLGEADRYRSQFETFDRLERGEKSLNTPYEAPLAWRDAGMREGLESVDEKSWHAYEWKDAFGNKQEIRYRHPLRISRDEKQIKAYANAFECYMARGANNMQIRYASDWKALSEGVDTAGGFLVPLDFQNRVIAKQATFATIRNNATIIQTSRDMVYFPAVRYGTPSTLNQYTTPMRMTWSGEAPATSSVIAGTDQTYGQITIPVHTALASQKVSRDLTEDSASDIAGFVADKLAESFALGENSAFISGSGVAQPMGFVTSVDDSVKGIPSIVSGTSSDIQTSGDAFSGKRLLNVFYGVPVQYRNQGVWIMNSATQNAVDSLVDAQKRPLVSALTVASIQTAAPDVIKNKPVVVDEFMPDIGASTYPIFFGNLKGYYIVDRVGMSVERNDQLYMETNMVLFLGRKRVGGDMVEPWQARLMKCST